MPKLPDGDPSRTVTTRKKWIAENKRIYKSLMREINKLFAPLSNDVSITPAAVREFYSLSDTQKVEWFADWLDRWIAANVDPKSRWFNSYLVHGYRQGMRSANVWLQSEIKDPWVLAALKSDLNTLDLGMGLPVHVDAIESMSFKVFTGYNGINAQMESQMVSVLVEGLAANLTFAEIGEQLNGRVNAIGLTRANLLARTETVAARNRGMVNQSERILAPLDAEVVYRWQTSLDERVRSSHAARHGNLYTKDGYLALLSEPNCRCAGFPEIKALVTKEDQASYAAQKSLGQTFIGE